MDYDFITTCNWTATGTYTLHAYRGSSTDVVTTHYASIHYRKKGAATWETLNSSGQMLLIQLESGKLVMIGIKMEMIV